jgi:hypothetical protein
MNTSSSYPKWMDIEVSTLSFMLEHGQWAPNEISKIRDQIDNRKAELMAGLGSASQLYWTAKIKLEVDDCCRVRRDPAHGWFLDRWIEEVKCWQAVGYIGMGGKLEEVIDNSPSFSSADPDGSIRKLRVIEDHVRPDLVFFLKSHDMQRPGYIEEKRAAAKAVKDENERLAKDKVLSAVDMLTEKRMKEFVSVEKAIQTGETVTMHGKSMEMFEKMTEAGKKAPEGPRSINPGLHPLKHKRDYSKGEGESYGRE